MPRYTNSFLTLALAYTATLIAAQAPTPAYTPIYTPIPMDDETPIYTPTAPSPSASNVLTIQTDTIVTLPSPTLPPTPSLPPTSMPMPTVPTPSGGFGNATSTRPATVPLVTIGAAGRTEMLGGGVGMGVVVAGVVGGFLV
ncbi:uncharacterized protein L3040_006838 [Drepanopeziza brunnea f. sp. 'multigermtubi']|uniref:Uncharacterized protein n=1 Tax=Marssonina brunnea f. sp. multigermtubi (strain MB_m1) TaxID=1072389 RepID=K1X2C2_MARBU|nr:uncharacterized protein MBM_02613 [Drepanopeziza brunnea f. sp. 'multigermtubi' MB_m1]EKD19376.1 hypothetical protein MBM_02613 [Drepanopeziza brunnea f. sp. 'multigermtubi' MB_m1]KAJ5037962.1 hypothetical protein L3040_006838 [Drepanopeziza brunnea f. sp. 'multigermtubi']